MESACNADDASSSVGPCAARPDRNLQAAPSTATCAGASAVSNHRAKPIGRCSAAGGSIPEGMQAGLARATHYATRDVGEREFIE